MNRLSVLYWLEKMCVGIVLGKPRAYFEIGSSASVFSVSRSNDFVLVSVFAFVSVVINVWSCFVVGWRNW